MFNNNTMPFWKGYYMAPDGAGGGAGAEGAGDAAGASESAESGGESKLSFDDFLKSDKTYQAEFDRRVAKAMETQKGKLDKEYASQLEAQKNEAAKLAKMNAEQKAEYERTQREESLAAREAEVTRRELAATARDTLREKGLPESLSEILVYTDAEACSASIDKVEKAFQTAVDEAVKEKIKGGNPPKSGSACKDSEESMLQEVKKGLNSF